MNNVLDVCLKACDALRLKERQRLLAVIRPHIDSLANLGVIDLVMAATKNDMKGVVEHYCKLMENPKTKKVIVEMLRDILKLYKSMEKEIVEVAQCYLSNCDRKSIELIIMVMQAYSSTIRTLRDKDVKKSLGDIHDVIIDHLKTSSEQLKAGVKRMPSAPKPKTPKRSIKRP